MMAQSDGLRSRCIRSIPDDLWKMVRLESARTGKTIREIVIDALQKALAGKRESNR